MSPDAILAAVAGPVGGLVVLACWVGTLLSGKQVSKVVMDAAVADRDKQIAFWQQAHAAERTRADASVLAAQTAGNILTALHKEAGT